MDPITIAVITWNRPRYLEAALAGWSRVRGIENARIEFYVEPGCNETVEICSSVGFTETKVHVNRARLGHDANLFQSMARSFRETDYVIQTLDDYVPSTDLLELHAWHRERYDDDQSVLGLTSGRDVPAAYGGLGGVWRCQLIGALTGFHRKKWNRLAARWHERQRSDNWWWWVNEHWLQSGPKYDVLFPALSRAENIGALDSWGRPVLSYQAERSCFVPDPPPQAYYEITGYAERGFQREIRSVPPRRKDTYGS